MKSPLRTLAYLLGEFATFAALLFVVRFILRGHLVPQLDEECNLGGAAVDMLAHGIRFPLPVYAPNDYENGYFYSSLLIARSFAWLGRNVLALKLPTHLVTSMGAVATLWLLRSCLDELRLGARQARWTAITVLVVATAFSPREIAFFSTCAVGIGSHAEGAAIDMVLLAAFARGRAGWSTAGIAAFWVLTGFALHVNKGTLVLVLVLAAAELHRARASPRRAYAAVVGFLLGSIPALLTMAPTDTAIGGWPTLASKLMLHAKDFPSAFVSTVLTLADYRGELLAIWILAIALALTLALRLVAGDHGSTGDGASSPSALAMTVSLLVLHAAGLTVMAQGGVDYYALHTYPPLVVVTALLAGWLCAAASRRWGARGGMWTAAMVVAVALVAYRPDTLTPSFAQVSALWGNRGGAACSWRFGEAFVRLQSGVTNYTLLGTAAIPESDRQTQLKREHHAIELCRSLSEAAQILDCIGGVARELQYGSGRIDGEPPAGLSAIERRAYAFYYGVRRRGDMTPCDDFRDVTLRQECRTAVQIDCFIRVDIATTFASGRALARPHCEIPPPPMDGYWMEMRSDLLSRRTGGAPERSPAFSDESLGACTAVVGSCY